MGCGSKPMVPFGLGAPPILVYFRLGCSLGVRAVWLLSHGYMGMGQN